MLFGPVRSGPLVPAMVIGPKPGSKKKNGQDYYMEEKFSIDCNVTLHSWSDLIAGASASTAIVMLCVCVCVCVMRLVALMAPKLT